MCVLDLEIYITEKVLFIQTHLLESVIVSLLWHLILQLFKLVFVDLECGLDRIGLRMLLVRVF